ncbi:MAG: gas vesicle protein K [Thermoguttaceae bacterium]
MSSTMSPNASVWQPTLEQPPQETKTAAAPRIKLNPENVRNGLAQLVLTLVDLIRELLERQALRRIEAGSLTEEQIERLGQTFCKLSDEIGRLREYFGLSDEDLNLDLGPLGNLR